MNQSVHMGLDSEDRQVCVNSHNNVPIAMLMWTILKQYYEMCYDEGWKIEIQLDLLGNKNQDMTLEQILRFVEAKEAGKRSATQLLLPHATDVITGSSYSVSREMLQRGRYLRTRTLARIVGRGAMVEMPLLD